MLETKKIQIESALSTDIGDEYKIGASRFNDAFK